MSTISNINVYLHDWQHPLTEGNYNQVDALVFAQLSYVPFEFVIKNYETKNLPMWEFTTKITEYNEFMKTCSEDKKVFLKELKESRRYSCCKIHHMKAIASADTQWAAFTIDISNEASVVAMRGTDGTTVGWKENFMMAYSIIGTNAQLAAFRYLKMTERKRIYLTGHSKGGCNVCSAYAMSNSYIRDKVIRIDNFDGPGMNPEFIRHYNNGYMELGIKLHNFYPTGSVIGMLLQDNPGTVVYVKTEIRETYRGKILWGQHDPFSFLANKTEFVKGKQETGSDYWNRILDKVVQETTNSQRYYLIQIMERMGLPNLIAGEDKSVAKNIVNGICCLAGASQQEKEVLQKFVILFIRRLIYSIKQGLHIDMQEGIIGLVCKECKY